MILSWFQWYNLLDDLDCRMVDGDCLTDQYHDYQLSRMVDLPQYMYDVEKSRFCLSELEDSQAS